MTHEEHEYEVYEMSAQASPIERHGTASPLQDTTGELPTPPSPCPADLIEPPLPADSHPPAPAPLSPPSSSQPALPLSVPSTPSAYPPAHPSAMPPKAGPSPLSRTDVQRDRILRTLALAKGIPLESPGPVAGPGPEAGRAFKARPAPAMGRPSGVGGAGGLVTAGGGPRLNKAAALRLGIKWEETGAARSSPVAVRGAAGPARTASIKGDAPIASLAQPAMMPRTNRASMLRAGGSAITPTKTRDLATNVAMAKQRADEDKARKRASVALPASLSAPAIQPRLNRASQLRAGAPVAPTAGLPRSTTALNVSTLANQPGAKVARRASVAGPVKSFAPPSIAPRLNKAALLRAQPGSTLPSGTSAITLAPCSTRPVSMQLPPRAATSSKTLETASSFARPTKASLLRAGMSERRAV